MKLKRMTKELSMIGIVLLSMLFLAFICLILIIKFGDVYIGQGANDFILPLGNGTYELSRPSAQMTCINKHVKNNIIEIIPPTVKRIDYNNNFIIVEQNSIKSGQNTYKYKYWIIDMNKKLEYGPLEENEFNLKKLDLNINKELRLKDVDNFNNKNSIK